MTPINYQKEWYQNLFIVVGLIAVISFFVGMATESEMALIIFIYSYPIGFVMIILSLFNIKLFRKK